MSHQDLDFAALLRKQGYRVTLQRQLILDAVCESGGHSTPEQIYERVRAKSTAINRATVYRTLDLLRELQVVVAADIGDGHTGYELAGETPHHHLICRKCGIQQQVDHKTIKSLSAKIKREYQFSVDLNHLTLFGLCEQCHNSE